MKEIVGTNIDTANEKEVNVITTDKQKYNRGVEED